MAKPQVTLTLAGDESKLTQTFARVGASSKAMADDVGASSKRVAQETTDSFDRAGEAADNVDTKSMGFRDTLTGVQDTMSGTAMIARGDLFNGFFTLGAGIGDLGSGFYNLLIPALKGFSRASIAAKVDTVRQTAATAAQRTVMIATTTATKAAAIGQWALNAAMRANPIGIVITALTLLVGGFILAYKKSETFRTIVNGALAGVQLAFRAVVTAAAAVYTWVRTNAPKIGGFFVGVAKSIAAPFQTAFNGIRSAWNNTVGGKGFSIPGWVPNLGGQDFRIPFFHTGGIVSGAMGSETLAVLRAGERVTGGRNGGQGLTIIFRSDGTTAGRAILDLVRKAVQVEFGGNVDAAFAR